MFLLRLERQLGYDLQGVTPLGSPIAWLFSQPVQGADNGFTMTGGVFNYTARATFQDTLETIVVKFQFKASGKKMPSLIPDL